MQACSGHAYPYIISKSGSLGRNLGRRWISIPGNVWAVNYIVNYLKRPCYHSTLSMHCPRIYNVYVMLTCISAARSRSSPGVLILGRAQIPVIRVAYNSMVIVLPPTHWLTSAPQRATVQPIMECEGGGQ